MPLPTLFEPFGDGVLSEGGLVGMPWTPGTSRAESTATVDDKGAAGCLPGSGQDFQPGQGRQVGVVVGLPDTVTEGSERVPQPSAYPFPVLMSSLSWLASCPPSSMRHYSLDTTSCS